MTNPKPVTKDEVAAKHECVLCPYSTTILSRYKEHMLCHSDEKPFECPECPFKSKWKGNIKHHLNLVHLLQSSSKFSRPFPCPEPGCNYAAKQKSMLNRHSKIHSGERSLLCSHPNCNYSTNHKKSLIIHTRTHTGEKPFVCQFQSCSFATATSSQLLRHSRTHTKEKPYKCPEPGCDYATGRSPHLKTHALTHEPKEGEERPSFPCPLCEYSGKSKARLATHIKSHTLEKLFKCDEPNCNFEARTKADIKCHKLNIHSDKKPFACSFESCDYRCKTKSSLFIHLKIHSDERRYKCELCSYRAKTRSAVSTHLRHLHCDSNFQSFKCTEPKCDFTAKSKGNFNRHLLVHQREKK